MAEEAIQLHLDALDDLCEDPPEPKSRTFKGKIPLRIEPSLHGDVYMMAVQDNESVNGFIEQAIREKLKRESGHTKVKRK